LLQRCGFFFCFPQCGVRRHRALLKPVNMRRFKHSVLGSTVWRVPDFLGIVHCQAGLPHPPRARGAGDGNWRSLGFFPTRGAQGTVGFGSKGPNAWTVETTKYFGRDWLTPRRSPPGDSPGGVGLVRRRNISKKKIPKRPAQLLPAPPIIKRGIGKGAIQTRRGRPDKGFFSLSPRRAR